MKLDAVTHLHELINMMASVMLLSQYILLGMALQIVININYKLYIYCIVYIKSMNIRLYYSNMLQSSFGPVMLITSQIRIYQDHFWSCFIYYFILLFSIFFTFFTVHSAFLTRTFVNKCLTSCFFSPYFLHA